MIALLQRVRTASVEVNQSIIGQIEHGLLVFIGVQKDDSEDNAKKLIDRVIQYRVFSDTDDKMNLSLKDINGGLLLVPQFTLAADTCKGKRPSFSSAAHPEEGERLFDYAVEYSKSIYSNIQTGQFGADMQVSLINDGPVTFWLEV